MKNWYTRVIGEIPVSETNPLPRISLLTSFDWQDYELLDSGSGQKLERYGPYRLVRPEPEAIWSPALPEKEWKAAHAEKALAISRATTAPLPCAPVRP